MLVIELKTSLNATLTQTNLFCSLHPNACTRKHTTEQDATKLSSLCSVERFQIQELNKEIKLPLQKYFKK